MLNNWVNFWFSFIKNLLNLAYEKLVNILGGHEIGINIHALDIAIYVLKSALTIAIIRHCTKKKESST